MYVLGVKRDDKYDTVPYDGVEQRQQGHWLDNWAWEYETELTKVHMLFLGWKDGEKWGKALWRIGIGF